MLDSGRALVVAVNKWDHLDPDIRAEVKRELDRRLGFVDFAKMCIRDRDWRFSLSGDAAGLLPHRLNHCQPGRYRLAAPYASAKLGSKGLPDLRMAKAMWMSFRMAAQWIAMPCLPLAFRRWQKARMAGLNTKADR